METTQPRTARVVLYARVSTEEQREGQTIDSQVSELERFARQKYWRIVDIYKDEAWSGALLARPELDRLRDDASKRLFDVVLINDVDRLARDVSHLGIVKRDLERNGAQVVFAKLPTEKGPTSNLMVNILGSFAEFERELIADRMRRGRRHKIEVRQQYLGSNTSYGYRYIRRDKTRGVEGRLELFSQEALTVKQMFDWVDREGLSARRVGARLTEGKVVPRKGGAVWGSSSVLRILRNEMYAGVWYYNKYESCEPAKPVKDGDYKHSLRSSLRLRAKSEWWPVRLPKALQIVEREQWERVQQRIDRNITFSPRNSKHQYLLKGLVKCGGCGARYVGDPCHGKFYYRCHARCKRVPTIKEDVLDYSVWQAIAEAMLNPSIIVDQIKKLQGLQSKRSNNLTEELTIVEAAGRELDKEEGRILEAYRQSVLSPDQLGSELEKLKTRRMQIEARRLTLTPETRAPLEEASERSIVDYCRQASNRLNTFSQDEKQEFLRLLIDEVVLDRGRIRIRGVIPVSDMQGDGLSKQPEASLLERRTADMTIYRRGRSSDAASGTAGMTNYSRGHNPVKKFAFEISRMLPQAKSIYEQVELDWIRERVRENPLVTLSKLSQLIHKQFGVTPSVSHMLRIQQLAGISRMPGSRTKVVTVPSIPDAPPIAA